MKNAMEKVRKGDKEVRLLFKESEEFSEMATSFNNMMDSIDIKESKIKRNAEADA